MESTLQVSLTSPDQNLLDIIQVSGVKYSSEIKMTFTERLGEVKVE